jgi:AcrR family transcriptional regulator
MSKKVEEKTSPREKILETALQLFNEQGIEYIGVREIAKQMGLKGGNITYYFPTKDDLVAALSEELEQVNNQTIVRPETPSLKGFLGMFHQAFINHYRFRCIFMSLPLLIRQNPKLADRYIGKVQQQRRNTLKAFLGQLQKQNILVNVSEEEMERILTFLGMTARTWISDSLIAHRDKSPEWCIRNYLLILGSFLSAYCTESGRQEIRDYFAETPGLALGS